MSQDHWLPGFNFNVEEWDEGDQYETLAICRSLALASSASRRKRSTGTRGTNALPTVSDGTKVGVARTGQTSQTSRRDARASPALATPTLVRIR